MLDDIAKRRFITIGVAAWLLLLPLALTSTNWAIRKLGGKHWNRLHKLVYVAAILRSRFTTGGRSSPASYAHSAHARLRCFCWRAPYIAWLQRRKARAEVGARSCAQVCSRNSPVEQHSLRHRTA